MTSNTYVERIYEVIWEFLCTIFEENKVRYYPVHFSSKNKYLFFILCTCACLCETIASCTLEKKVLL